jgi:C-terminal processing protease CtpA/Prc
MSDVLANTLTYFANGILGYFVRREAREPLAVPAADINGSQNIPLVVLVGRGTASFGEIFSGIFKDIGRAFLIGEQTEGNVEILGVHKFADESMAWIAQGSFRPLNHPEQDWEQTGIIPDLMVASNWDEVTQATDPAILAALMHFDQ